MAMMVEATAARAGNARLGDYPLVVFDWDGTVMDSTAVIVQSIRAACADLGLPVPSEVDASYVIGLGLRDALHHAVPTLDPGAYDAMAQAYRRHYFAHDQDLTLFPGILDLLLDLKRAGFSLGVATGKSRQGLDRALGHVDLRHVFDATRTADETASKPDPRMLREIMGDLGRMPGETLMIGDTTHDLELARNAGVAAAAVTYGAHPASALATYAPVCLAPTVDVLRKFLLGD